MNPTPNADAAKIRVVIVDDHSVVRSGLEQFLATTADIELVATFYKLETSEWNLHKYDDLIDKPLDNSNGSLKLNPGPGLGVEMNRGYLEANVVE
jgi:L-alanine-DL-glutamate epimerase-like enolase superfamily enzyme